MRRRAEAYVTKMLDGRRRPSSSTSSPSRCRRFTVFELIGFPDARRRAAEAVVRAAQAVQLGPPDRGRAGRRSPATCWPTGATARPSSRPSGRERAGRRPHATTSCPSCSTPTTPTRRPHARRGEERRLRAVVRRPRGRHQPASATASSRLLAPPRPVGRGVRRPHAHPRRGRRGAALRLEPDPLAADRDPPGQRSAAWPSRRGRRSSAVLGRQPRPRRFDDPDRFDIHRANARHHISFGKGVHFCLGSAMARMEARVVLDVLAERVPSLRLVGATSRTASTRTSSSAGPRSSG